MPANTAIVKVRRLVSNNKAIAAALSTFGTALSGAVATWVYSGQFDATELRLSAGGLIAAAITGAITWATSAGDAEIEPQIDKATEGDPRPNEVVIQAA